MCACVFAKSCVWYIRKIQSIKMTSYPYNINTMSLSYPYHFSPISMQILWALVAHRLGWLIAPTATAATAAPSTMLASVLTWVIHPIHTHNKYSHYICHHLNAASWNKKVLLICTLKFYLAYQYLRDFVCRVCMFSVCVCVRDVCVTNCTCRIESTFLKKFKKKGLSWV